MITKCIQNVSFIETFWVWAVNFAFIDHWATPATFRPSFFCGHFCKKTCSFLTTGKNLRCNIGFHSWAVLESLGGRWLLKSYLRQQTGDQNKCCSKQRQEVSSEPAQCIGIKIFYYTYAINTSAKYCALAKPNAPWFTIDQCSNGFGARVVHHDDVRCAMAIWEWKCRNC